MSFPTDITNIQNQLNRIDPKAYAASRNYLNGAVTRLSPYLSRGVISTRQVLQSLGDRGFDFGQVEALVRELAWREFYQRVWQSRNPDDDLRHTQSPCIGPGLCHSIVHASTGIDAIDASIRTLSETGYMHNHCRMYTAALHCNLGQRAWIDGAQWMYYHLLDGDWASNACSWQWVAGSFSSKKYYANQENINRYTGSTQTDTFLDAPYESFPEMRVPAVLADSTGIELSTTLPASDPIPEKFRGKVFLYNYYNMDSTWCAPEEGLRILLLEPEHFRRYPVSEQCIRFLLDLAGNIPGVIVRCESFDSLQQQLPDTEFHYREHPLATHYTGIRHEREWMCEEVTGYFPSFFAYWKRAEKHLRRYFG